jgi:hypothetical protein
VVVGSFNTPVPSIDRSSRIKINKEILELNDNVDLIEWTDVYRVFHPATAKYTCFSLAHGTFFLQNRHILGHKGSLNKYKKVETTPAYYLITMQ